MAAYYIIVEGRVTEKIVYERWLSYLNPNLQKVNFATEITNDSYFLLSGNGYPSYIERITLAIDEITELELDCKLAIIIDTEEMSFRDKYNEIESVISTHSENFHQYVIIPQHFCIETWALGNKSIIRRQPISLELKECLEGYNVLRNDPEDMPNFMPTRMNTRAQCAGYYLKRAAIEKKTTYNKSKPHFITSQSYFEKIFSRANEDGHIQSFLTFYNEFKTP